MNPTTRCAAALACLVALCAGIVSAADGQTILRLSEPVQSSATTETFGAALTEPAHVLSLRELISDADRFAQTPVVVKTRIAQVCQKKGCFFIAQEGSTAVRVSFKDYGFFVPTDASGKVVTLAGELTSRDVSPAQAAHFVEDVGADAPAITAGRVYEIVATSVRIPKD